MASAPDPHNAWRPVIAALANEEALAVFARLVLGEDLKSATSHLSAKKRDRVVQALTSADLLTGAPDHLDKPVVNLPFSSLLAAAAVKPPTGVERFIKDGRLDRYPMKASERHEVLTWIAQHALQPGEELNEAQLNERLKVFSNDYATLRRYLVDLELLERTRSGSSYALASDNDA